MNRTAVVLLAVLIAGIALTPTPSHALPACEHEDGNTDGAPCLWFDPDTGTAFYVGFEDYR